MNAADSARIDFVLNLRRRWADRLYPAMRAQFDASPAGSDASPAGSDASPAGFGASPGGDTGARVHALPVWRWFAFLERNAQKALWRAVGEVVAKTPASAGPRGPSSVELDPSLALPAWYTGIDIHIQPNGPWSSAEAARVYELGAMLVMLGENDDYTFHRLFADALPKRPFRRVVDLGCGFGKSAWPIRQAHPEAEVIGIDLAGPCLELAAERCNARGLDLRFRQADCARTGLDGGCADLVTATMLIHELPPKHLAATIREAARLLAPGGSLRILDFHLTGDAFRDLAMREHGERNNEPFMPPMFDTDLLDLCRETGLVEARWVAFDERGGGRLQALEWPKRPEWHFPWAILEAEKPGASAAP